MQNKKSTILLLILSTILIAFGLWSFTFLSSFAHEDNTEFKPKYKKITLDKDAIKTLGIKTQKIKDEIIDEVVKTTGQIEEVPNNRFEINSPVQGKVSSILVNLGDIVKAGEPLAVIESTEISKVQSEVNQYEAELELAKNIYEREKTLFEEGVSPKKDFDAAKANLTAIEAKLNAAKSSLKILTGNISKLEQGIFRIKTKKSGIITERNITLGEVVNPNQILFKGVDLSTVWASADIYEKDISKVKLEQTTFVTPDLSSKETFEGKTTFVGSIINKETRTLPVKAILKNEIKNPLLKPGAFIQMFIHTGNKKKSIVIPRTSLVEIDKEDTEGIHKHIVYLKKKNKFIPRKIEVEAHDSNTVEVISGLMAGEIIITQGAYQLKYEEGKEEESAGTFNLMPSLNFIVILFLVIILITIFLKKKKLNRD